jgi:hypothetical protein
MQQSLASAVSDSHCQGSASARKQGFDYTITPEKVRAKAKAPGRKRRAATAAAVPSAPASRNGGRASPPPTSEGQLLAASDGRPRDGQGEQQFSLPLKMAMHYK